MYAQEVAGKQEHASHCKKRKCRIFAVSHENFEMQVVKKSLPQEARKLPQASRSCLYISVHLEEVCGFRCLLYYNIISNVEFIQPMSTLWQQ